MGPSPTNPLRFTVNAPHENMGKKSNAMKYNRLPLLASLLIPLASPAEEGLLQPPSDANDYVRVWSETIGVENVIRADRAHQLGNSLDFYITTTNVLDGFKALVRLEEINGDAWKLTSPGSGVPVPMRPGERIEYVVADRTGTEQHLPGHVALYRVDVRIGDMDEPFEETVGASLFHKETINGYNDPTLNEFLVPVTIRCFTPDITDIVSIEARTSKLLVRNAAGELHEALSAYTAAELGTLEFFLLGTTLSTTDRDQAVRVVHVKTQCHDEALFTVRPKSEFCIRTVSFWNDVAIASDLGVEFVRPQYKDNNADGILDGSEDHAWPVCYVRNTRPSIQATLACADALQSGSVLVRAEATGFALPATTAPVSGGVATLPATLTAQPLANAVDFQDPLTVNWFVSTDAGATWESAGSSTNRFYVIWDAPAIADTAKRLETLFYIGCRGAKGVTGTTGADNGRVLDAVWENQFRTLHVTRACDGKVLTYYGFRDNNDNGIYDHGDDDMNWTASCKWYEYGELIQNRNGQCNSWADLMLNVLFAQGIQWILPSQPAKIQGIVPNDSSFDYFPDGIIINNWQQYGNGKSFGKTNHKLFLIWNDNAGVMGSSVSSSTINDTAWDVLGVSGQGNSPNPCSVFGRHRILRIGDQFYDPSYGSGPFPNLKDFADASLAGLSTLWNTSAGLCDHLLVPHRTSGSFDIIPVKIQP